MRCRDAAAGSLTDRRSVALSPVTVGTSRVTAGPRRLTLDISSVKRAGQ